uniref:Uncharacterized protein n=1 Tax=Globisporangium ultimum (strain ATCC 200006 / CBS 805.95 / DAOM BR144) TaxID=431595 RepID=K3WK15_GLOUD
MSNHGDDGTFRRTPTGAADAHPEDAMDTSKDEVMARIKRNFYLETQAFRKRILDATDETARARERVDSAQDAMMRLTKKCYKLKRLVQEKDATIQSLQAQHEVKFPMLMRETMRSVHGHLGVSSSNNQDDDFQDAVPQPLSISRMREKVSDREAADEQLHEYETQIAQLYQELQDEKQRNEMLTECLREQKHAKAKLMKACKHAKQEIETLKNNGMSQLLVDMQTKCQRTETEKQDLENELRAQTAAMTQMEDHNELLVQQVQHLMSTQSNWEDVIRSKDAELLKVHEQVKNQQVALENMEFDMSHARIRHLRASDQHNDDDTREERDLLVQALQSERSKRKDAEDAIHEFKRTIQHLQRNREVALLSGSAHSAASDRLICLLKQVLQIQHKAAVLHQLVASYSASTTIDIQLLADESWRDGAPLTTKTGEIVGSEDSLLTLLTQETQLAARNLTELQLMVEELCAHAMGSSCALQ